MTVKSILMAGACLGLLLTTGCVTEQINPEDDGRLETRLIVTRSGNEVNLSWRSRMHVVYTLYYGASRSSGAQWQVVPGAERVVGTGDTVYFKDRVPANQPRFYRIMAMPMADYKP